LARREGHCRQEDFPRQEVRALRHLAAQEAPSQARLGIRQGKDLCREGRRQLRSVVAAESCCWSAALFCWC
jgi:hypothetical protein